INDAPSFTASLTTIPAFEDAGPQVLASWATFDPGPGETGQGVLAYTVSNLTNASLFSTPPSVSADGTLSFVTAPNATGTSTFQVRVRDDGGTASGGVDTSAPRSVTISVAAVNDPPTVSLNAIPTVIED